MKKKRILEKSPLIIEEQKFLDSALETVSTDIQLLRSSKSDMGANKTDSESLDNSNLRRAQILTLAADNLIFGSFIHIGEDEVVNYHIGRAHVVVDDDLVIEFEAPIAAHFYQGIVDNKVLSERRTIRVDGPNVLNVELERYANGSIKEVAATQVKKDKLSANFSEVVNSLNIRAGDILLEDLLAVRTKEMKSIVLTIQSNQDQLIRSEFRKPFAVSGGPGTGKTIVGLHRVSNILYQLNQTSSAATALVIGPTDRFVAYIQNILPSLGKTSVKHQSIPDLCLSGLSEKRRQKISIEIAEHPSIQIVKSSVAVGLIIRKLIVNTIKPVNLRISTPDETVCISKDEIMAWLYPVTAQLINNEISYADARQGFKRWIMPKVEKSMNTKVNEDRKRVRQIVEKEIEDARSKNLHENFILFNFIDQKSTSAMIAESVGEKIFTILNPLTILNSIHSDESYLDFDPKRIIPFTDAEVAMIKLIQMSPRDRKSKSKEHTRLSKSDLPLLYEISYAIQADSVVNSKFSHVLVDESQDLSPIEWQIIKRMVDGGSITVLADFLQRTEVGAVSNWDEIWRLIGVEKQEINVLPHSYRVPKQILNFAKRAIHPKLRSDVPISLLDGKTPSVKHFRHMVDVKDLKKVLKKAGDGRVGVITTSASFNSLASSFVEIVNPVESKGLEFDHVVVVEPGDWNDESEEQYQLLYVALTRSTKTLTILHHAPLPKRLTVRKSEKIDS